MIISTDNLDEQLDDSISLLINMSCSLKMKPIATSSSPSPINLQRQTPVTVKKTGRSRSCLKYATRARSQPLITNNISFPRCSPRKARCDATLYNMSDVCLMPATLEYYMPMESLVKKEGDVNLL